MNIMNYNTFDSNNWSVEYFQWRCQFSLYFGMLAGCFFLFLFGKSWYAPAIFIRIQSMVMVFEFLFFRPLRFVTTRILVNTNVQMKKKSLSLRAYGENRIVFIDLDFIDFHIRHTSTERNSMDKSNFWPWIRNFKICPCCCSALLSLSLSPYPYFIVCSMFISRAIALYHDTYQTIIGLFRVCAALCVCTLYTPLIISNTHLKFTVYVKSENWKKKLIHGQDFMPKL